MPSKSSNSEVAVLQTQMDEVLHKLGSIEGKLDEQANTFVSREVFELKMAELTVRVTQLENRKTLIGWITPTLSAALGSVFTFLIIEKLR
jgi:hypothetical protein